VAALATAGRLPDVVPSGGTTIVQVLDDAGRVSAASAGGDRLVPLLEPADLARARAGAAVELSGRRLGVSELLRVVGVRAGPDGGQTVLVAGPVDDVQRSVAVVEKAMVVVCLVLVAGAAVLSRWLVGSALRPVETLTRDAATLGTRGGAGTLPLPAADDEIRRLAVTLNGMLARLEAAARRQRAFVADAAHELRSPLASIRTAVEVSRLTGPHAADDRRNGRTGRDGDDYETGWRETADGVLEDTARMSRLVEDLLLLARLDDARETPGNGTGTGDLAAVADRVVERLERQHGQSGPVLRESTGTIAVRAGEDVLERILVNLVENAVRYARSRVEVTVQRSGGDAVLTVTDDGPGVPAADRERVFERFTRLDDARSRDAGGSGLGLAIVRELVRAHGGDVHLEDAQPGLRAVVRLPAAPERAGPPGQDTR
jgi:signal transduction histidine kinase